MAQMRLDRLLGDLGLASRRELKEIIRSGRVAVDDVTVRSPEAKADPGRQTITLDGQPLHWRRFHYYMMDKPAGVVTATEDREQRTVLALLPAELRRMGLFPVGRLDKDTTGLLLLTDDGDFAHRVISPKSAVEKRYYAQVEGEPDAEDAEAFRAGLTLRDGTKCAPALLEPLGEGRCIVTVTEGKYHQVKRMLASRGKPVTQLRRIAVGSLELDETLGEGGFRELTEVDLCRLFNASSMGKMSKKSQKTEAGLSD